MMVLLLATGVARADNLVLITSQSSQNANDSINWGQLGSDGTVLPANFAVHSALGTNVPVQLSGANSIVAIVCSANPCSWTGGGNLTQGDSLLWTSNTGTGGNGPVALNFGPAVIGGGAYVQADGPGAFTAQIQAYNGATLLGSFTVNSSNGDAAYIGVVDQSGANITSLVFSITSCNQLSVCTDFAIDKVGINTAGSGQQYTLTLIANPQQAGSIVATPPPTNGKYLDGTNVCLGASPNNGWVLSSWSGDPLDQNFCLVMNSNKSVTANFTAVAALQFVPLTPCRLVDTRGGGAIPGGTFKTYNLPQLAQQNGCPNLASATAYSLNVTVVPPQQLRYLTIWPAGEVQPVASTLNSDGRTKANAAIVLGGATQAVSVYAKDTTDLLLDIEGYFQPSNGSTMAFYPLPPCRLVDTRGGNYLHRDVEKDFLVAGSCGIPSNAQAYSFNITAIPVGGQRLGFLTAWPAGQLRPNASTLNDPTGTIVANAAIIPAGGQNTTAVYATSDTDLLIDVNGYFAAPGTGGLSFYPGTPCRVLDTRGTVGEFTGELTVPVSGTPCAPPSVASYVFNATVIPDHRLGFLTLWPHGSDQPTVSTLNAPDGALTSNMAIVSSTDGEIDAFAKINDYTQLILDLSGYFAH